MAGCYHDTQDFKSDLNIEVAREADILEAGQDLNEIECDKNPGHDGFIPFKDLTLEHLPIEIKNREMFDDIKKNGNCVVRLVVDKKINGRLIKESGSGCVIKLNNVYFIKTNNHVVKTDDEVKQCTVEFHYDDISRSSVLTSRGVELFITCPYRDHTAFRFHPVPDFLQHLDFKDISKSLVIMLNNNKIVTFNIDLTPIKSQMKFFFGTDLNSSKIHLMFISWPNSSISYMKSSYFKFKPIPSNIQQLTSIKIHKDEDDGNGRVIPGDVVKFGDEFVVKISESIFQDEVKKCRLVLNDEVIGCGTRLYFEQVKSSDIYRGIDLERQMDMGRENHWIFDFHPIPRHISEDSPQTERYYNICCIGHPHGGAKMVTFGRVLCTSLQRFDKLGRRITKPNKDCKCQEVNCLQYTCKTCPGSSGSPVHPLFEENDWSRSYTHFMGERADMILPNGELIENMNIAWSPS